MFFEFVSLKSLAVETIIVLNGFKIKSLYEYIGNGTTNHNEPMVEVWRSIGGYADKYQVSNKGRIWSLVSGRILNNCGVTLMYLAATCL